MRHSALLDDLKYRIEFHKSPGSNQFKPLSYCELQKLKNTQAITPEEYEELIDFSYTTELGNPLLFRPAKQTNEINYSINFIWLHQKPITNNRHLFGDDNVLLRKHLLDPISDWLQKEPFANITYWLDKNKINQTALTNTLRLMSEHLPNLPVRERVRFAWLQDMDLIQKNPELLADSTPLYFRIDIAKALIANHVLAHDGLDYAVVTDTDVSAIVREQLFDQNAVTLLRTVGIMFGYAATVEENSFIILARNAELDTLNKHRSLVIDASIEILKEKGPKVAPEAVYHRYAYLRAELLKAYRTKYRLPAKKSIHIFGKAMIIPPSQFGGGGYTTEQIVLLKAALVGVNGCADG